MPVVCMVHAMCGVVVNFSTRKVYSRKDPTHRLRFCAAADAACTPIPEVADGAEMRKRKTRPEAERRQVSHWALGRPDLRGCALLDSWRSWCPRGLTSTRVPDT